MLQLTRWDGIHNNEVQSSAVNSSRFILVNYVLCTSKEILGRCTHSTHSCPRQTISRRTLPSQPSWTRERKPLLCYQSIFDTGNSGLSGQVRTFQAHFMTLEDARVKISPLHPASSNLTCTQPERVLRRRSRCSLSSGRSRG